MTDALDPLTLPLSGTSLIEASAGTGKTHAIATLFLRLLLERELAVDEILVVTFTEAAAAELRDRIRARLRSALAELAAPGEADADVQRLLAQRRAAGHDDRARLTAALRAFDLASISTIHGFCQGVLQRQAFETGVALSTELLVDDRAVVETVVRDYWARALYDADPRFAVAVQDAGLYPPKLMRLARQVAAHPDLELFPATSPPSNPPAPDEYVAAYREARAIWTRESAQVQELLRSSANLLKSFDVAQLPARAKLMDAFLRDPNPGAQLQLELLDTFCSGSLLEKTRAAARRAGLTPKHAFFDACQLLRDASAPLRRHQVAKLVDFKLQLAAYVRRELPKRKRAAAVQAFDDLLLQLDAALRGRGGKQLAERIRARFRAALIDEFQDTDPLQYRIFKTVFGHRGGSLLLIGDPKQAIYAFRGADVYAYLDAARSIGGRRVTMRHNWRSDPPLLAAIARLFDVERPFALDEIEMPEILPRPGAHARLLQDGRTMPAMTIDLLRRDGADLQRNAAKREWADQVIPSHVGDAIASLLSSGATLDDGVASRPIHAGDIAVLTRKNAQALSVQKALRERGIPSVVYGDSTVFESDEATELARVLASIAEPSHAAALRSALATELLGSSADELVDIDRDEALWERWVELFRDLHELWTGRGFMQMFRALLARTGAPARLLARSGGERSMTNLLHTAELLHAAASEQHLGPAGVLRWFDEQRNAGNNSVEAFKLRLERDDRAVQLITVHRSKGLEYPIVYCPFAWEAEDLFGEEKEDTIYHDPEHELGAVLDVRPSKDPDKKTALELAGRERTAEALRLLYVAVTRARHRCVLTWVPGTRTARSPLSQLLFSPPAPATQVAPSVIQARVENSSDDELIAAFVARGGGAWSVEASAAIPTTGPAVASAAAPEPDTSGLRAQLPRASIDRLWRTSSFSHMASAQATAGPLFVELAPRPRGVGTIALTARSEQADFADARAHDEALSRTATWSSDDELDRALAPAAPTVTLAGFPRGVRAGNFFHDVLEHLDFAADAPTMDALVQGRLREHGFVDDGAWAEVVVAGLQQVVATPLLGPGSFALRDVPRTQRLDELEFLLPVADADSSLGRRALAAVFRDHPEGLPPGYAERVAALGFSPLRGFLKGFIDLVFEHDGRWYVLDYKTNHLGDHAADYDTARLATVMADDHYVLQYHLYTLALVRMLAQRQPGFDYERDFGGVMYLFLRGMAPGQDTGIWRERPPAARIAALSNLLQRPGAA
ncbi:MAG: exodeoxyribonuclease V subunit beta [Deltaproteobacteria bacterium]|nr:exodeoxyribonuclease V subunit beta [Deltaproteobacteria bacterium]